MGASKGILGVGTVLALAACGLLVVISIIQKWVYVELKKDNCIVGNLGLYTSSFSPECAKSIEVPGEGFVDKATELYWPLFGIQAGFGDTFATYGLAKADFPDEYTCKEGVDVAVAELKSFPTASFMTVQSTLVETMFGAMTYGIWGTGTDDPPFDSPGLDAIAASKIAPMLDAFLLNQTHTTSTCKLFAGDNVGPVCGGTLPVLIKGNTNQVIGPLVAAHAGAPAGAAKDEAAANLAAALLKHMMMELVLQSCAFDGSQTVETCKSVAASKLTSSHGEVIADAAKPATDFVAPYDLNMVTTCEQLVTDGIMPNQPTCEAGFLFPVKNFYELLMKADQLLDTPTTEEEFAFAYKLTGIQNTFELCYNQLSSDGGVTAPTSMTAAECVALCADIPTTFNSRDFLGTYTKELPYTLFYHPTADPASFEVAVSIALAGLDPESADYASLKAFSDTFIGASCRNETASSLYNEIGVCTEMMSVVVVDKVLCGILGCENEFDTFLAGDTALAKVEATSRLLEVAKTATVECELDQQDLDAIKQAQVFIPISISLCGLAAILGGVALAKATKPLGLVAAALCLIGGALATIALLAVQNSPVYSKVGVPCGETDVPEVCYKEDSAALLAKIGILAGLLGGLVQAIGAAIHQDEGFSEMKDVGMYNA